MAFYTYILASGRNGTIYIGSTDNLARRVHEHQQKVRPGFTSRYNVTKLVWFEVHESREAAKDKERRMKEWKRAWKLRVIEGENPEWEDFALRLNELLAF